MDEDRSHRAALPRGRFLLIAALTAALLGATTAAAGPSPADTASGAARLSAAITSSQHLARARLRPVAGTLAHGLPGILNRLGSLRKPAATTEEQLGFALAQLQQVSPLAYDQHLLPATMAVGRAYAAATGSDPLTSTAIDPEYAGLGRELAIARAALRRRAARAAGLAHGVNVLTVRLAREKRDAARLARALERLRRGDARSRR
ncbi:MAG: hypothetical protein BGO11_03760 [Solirubrobacterales bacterium 70-9]|nr:MAG: hypothetical protein BGO11_03760 [Solirubrobacterales bacterium 70-9]